MHKSDILLSSSKQTPSFLLLHHEINHTTFSVFHVRSLSRNAGVSFKRCNNVWLMNLKFESRVSDLVDVELLKVLFVFLQELLVLLLDHQLLKSLRALRKRSRLRTAQRSVLTQLLKRRHWSCCNT